ncbi:MAG TPA: hypothetical protein VG895_01925 [Patescibacteria group bacterium]|nr:hypothetical protein [Patescibacteria group bacterium]
MKSETRVRELDQLDIRYLEGVYKSLPYAGSFWLSVEKALSDDSSSIQLHRCTCGALVMLTRQYVKRSKLLHLKRPLAECWHKEGFVNSISSINSQIRNRTNMISKLLIENPAQAYKLGAGLLPTDSFYSFDYGLWRLQYMLFLNEYRSSTSVNKRKKYKVPYVSAFNNLFERAEKVNPSEYKKALKMFFEDKTYTTLFESVEIGLNKIQESDNLRSEEAYRRITGGFVPVERLRMNDVKEVEKRSYQIALDAYQAYFEISEVLNIIYNIINICNGGSFMLNPFAGKKYNGLKIGNKKGLMIKKIIDDCPDLILKRKIRMAYDAGLRNSTSGHNDYLIDMKREVIKIKSSGKIYKVDYLIDKIDRIKAVVDSIYILINLENYADKKVALGLTGIHSIVINFEKGSGKPLPALTIFQFWTNAENDSKGKRFKMLHFRISKDRKAVLFSPSNVMIVPGAAALPVHQHLLDWLENAYKSDKVFMERIVIVPRIELFLKLARKEVTLDSHDFFAISKTNHELIVEKKYLKHALKLLRKKKLPVGPDLDNDPMRDLQKYYS